MRPLGSFVSCILPRYNMCVEREILTSAQKWGAGSIVPCRGVPTLPPSPPSGLQACQINYQERSVM
jgi:hypothetical protein